MLNYEINSNTFIILPTINNEAKVYEKNNTLLVKEKVMNIIKNSCLFFGCSYEGRHEGTKKLINVAIKAPIIIEEYKRIIFFPTASPRENGCIWISYNNLIKYEKKDTSTVLYFKDNFELEIPVSYNIIDNQIVRCIKLEKEIISRKKNI